MPASGYDPEYSPEQSSKKAASGEERLQVIKLDPTTAADMLRHTPDSIIRFTTAIVKRKNTETLLPMIPPNALNVANLLCSAVVVAAIPIAATTTTVE